MILTPPELRTSHRLSAWLGCTLEIKCGCGRIASVAVRGLLERYGDVSLERVLGALRCQVCRRSPAPVYLVAGRHREMPPGLGSVGDWAAEVVRMPKR